jgi:hypothetical protein
LRARLRTNFVTYGLAERKTETWIADRTGHRLSATINRYRRRARNVLEAGLGSLTALDLAIPDVCRREHGGKRGGRTEETGRRKRA